MSETRPLDADAGELTINRPDGRKVRYVLAEPPPEPTPPAEAPSEPSVEEERWAFASWVDGTAVVCRHGWKQTNHPDKPVFRVIVRSKAADDELREKSESFDALVRDLSDLDSQCKVLTRERDEAREERESLETQLAEAINSQVDATEQLEREREDYETLVKEAVELRKQIATPTSSGPADEGWMEKAWLSFYVSAGRVEKDRFLAALRAHAPAARYPEVVEFLDAVGSGPWSMSAGSCEGKASYYVQSFRITKGTWFADDTLAAACRAALDSRKERSDG